MIKRVNLVSVDTVVGVCMCVYIENSPKKRKHDKTAEYRNFVFMCFGHKIYICSHPLIPNHLINY